MGEPVDQEDGRLEPQKGHLLGIQMPNSFIDQREGSNVELKTKGRIERELQWGRKVKESSALQNCSKGMSRLQKGCIHLFYSQVGRNKLSIQELSKGTLVYSQAEEQGPLNQAIMYDCNNKSKSKKQFQHGLSIGFFETFYPYHPGEIMFKQIFLKHNYL